MRGLETTPVQRQCICNCRTANGLTETARQKQRPCRGSVSATLGQSHVRNAPKVKKQRPCRGNVFATHPDDSNVSTSAVETTPVQR